MLHLYFFVPFVTDRGKDINQFVNNMSLTPIDIKQRQINAWADNSSFSPSHLDMSGLDKFVANETMVKYAEHIVKVSNLNLLRNADRLLSRCKVDVPVDWIDNNKIRIPP